MAEYIEREAARNAVLGFERYTGIAELPVEFAEAEIDKLPAADVAPVRHGRWNKRMEVNTKPTYTAYTPLWSCSCCGAEYDPAFCQMINFCPDCGARMDGGEE